MQLNCYTRGTRKLVLHHVNCLLSPSLCLSRPLLSIYLSLSVCLVFAKFSQYRMAVRVERGLVFRVYRCTRGIPAFFTCLLCRVCEFTTNRWLLGRVVWASLQPPLPFDEFPRRQCLPEPVVVRQQVLWINCGRISARCYSFTLNRRADYFHSGGRINLFDLFSLRYYSH